MTELLNLTYGQIEALVTGMLDIHPERTSAIGARFNSLRRMGFPDGVNIGTTGRFKYDLDATLSTLLLFALNDALVMPQQAVALLQRAWPKIGPVVRAILGHLTFQGTELLIGPRPIDASFLVLRPASLVQLRHPENADEKVVGSKRQDFRPREPGQLSLVSLSDISAMLDEDMTGRPRPAALILDLHSIVSWAAQAIVRAAWASPVALGAQIAPPPHFIIR